MRFDEEEKLLIMFFWWEPREDLITELHRSMNHMEDEELIEIAKSCIRKLEQMTDEEYLNTDFYSFIA